MHTFRSKKHPRNIVDAQFSIPCVVAVALQNGQVNLEHFAESRIRDPEILGLANKIEVQVSKDLNRGNQQGIEPTRVTIVTRDGDVASEVEPNPLGSLCRPMSFEECVEKFYSCTKEMKEERREHIIETINRIEEVTDISQLVSLLMEPKY